jgi:hypothetical protein
MAVAHITGRGAPELVRFWTDPPLVREPDVTLFGLDRVDASEQTYLASSPMPRLSASDIQTRGSAAAARSALERVHAGDRQLVLHLDVDVIASEDFSAAGIPAAGGLRLHEVQSAFEVFAQGKNLAAIEVTEFDPSKDSDGSAARAIVDLIVTGLAARLAAIQSQASAAVSAAVTGASATGSVTEPPAALRTAQPMPSAPESVEPVAGDVPATSAEPPATPLPETSEVSPPLASDPSAQDSDASDSAESLNETNGEPAVS